MCVCVCDRRRYFLYTSSSSVGSTLNEGVISIKMLSVSLVKTCALSAGNDAALTGILFIRGTPHANSSSNREHRCRNYVLHCVCICGAAKLKVAV